jgi:uncharacterized protein (UPF0333 family)
MSDIEKAFAFLLIAILVQLAIIGWYTYQLIDFTETVRIIGTCAG